MRFLRLSSGTLIHFPCTRVIRTGGIIQAVTRPSSLSSPWSRRLPGEIPLRGKLERPSTVTAEPSNHAAPAHHGGLRHCQTTPRTEAKAAADVDEKNDDHAQTQTSSRSKRKPKKCRRQRLTSLRKKKRAAPLPAPPKKPQTETDSVSDSDSDEETEDGSDEEYEVERVVDVRHVRKRTEYLIKWAGYPADVNSWEPEVNLSCDKLIRAFWRRRKLETSKVETAGNRRRG